MEGCTHRGSQTDGSRVKMDTPTSIMNRGKWKKWNPSTLNAPECNQEAEGYTCVHSV